MILKLLKLIEDKAKKEQDSAGRHPLTGAMMDGSSIGGGPKVRQQYEVECECITNRYGQRWDYELGGKADRFVEGLIRTGRLDEVWRIDNDEAAEFYPVSHTGACRCRNRSRMRMERASNCLRHCQETAQQFEDWKMR